MVNKYQSINDLTQLRKPRKKIIPQGQDLSQFETSNPNLKLMANFGMEMLKFLPKFEQLAYAGKMKAVEGDTENGVEMKVNVKQTDNSYKEESMWVTKEWYEAFNQYDLSKMGFTAEETKKMFEGHDYNGDGYVNPTDDQFRPITNADSIADYQQMTGKSGLDWRFGWIFGQHHRVGDFGNFGTDDGMGFAGAGTGKNFKNIDFDITASEYDHINYARSDTLNVTTASSNAYFAKDVLGKIGKSMGDVGALLQSKFPGQSFYDVVLSGAYKSLSKEDAFLLIAGMFESRERGWDMMSKAFGAVDKTRNDQAMMNWIDNNKDSILNSTNSYLDHHELSLFPFFLYIQHSVQNQMAMFYEKYQDTSRGDGYNMSVLDKKQFLDFVKWAGRETFDGNTGTAKDIDSDGSTTKGILYEYRDSLSGDKKQAVQELIDAWFGATELKNKRPTWEGYADVADGGSWKALSGFGQATIVTASTAWVPATITQVYVPNITDKSYGWDRKWSGEGLKVKGKDANNNDIEGTVYNDAVSGTANRFVDLLNIAYGNQANFNSKMGNIVHYNYLASQFAGLNFNSIIRGNNYDNNWAVHAIGNYMKQGEAKDILGVMEKIEKRRIAAAEFKQDTRDYIEKKQELEDQKAREEAEAAKARAQAQARGKKKAPTMAQGGAAKSAEEKAAFERSLQKMRQKFVGQSAKRKSLLKKTQQSD